MMALKAQTINHVINIEGGYVNDPDDSGGETNFGITVAVARDNGYMGDMYAMPRSIAFHIYADEYWHALKADDLVLLSEAIAKEVVDTGVNMGVGRAAIFLQRALNVFNRREKLYPDLTVDSSIGPATISALREYLSQRNEKVLCRALNCLQGAHYIKLAERRQKDEEFIYGWLKNRVVV